MSSAHSLSESDHRRLAEFVGRVAGIQLPAHKRTLIETRLRKRLKVTGRPTMRDYVDYALSPTGVDEQVLLIDALTTNKTDFFREPAHFDFLERFVREELAPERNLGWKSPLSVWSAACSTGEEPYTLAMVLFELQAELPGFHFSIDATDIAQSVLETARKGIYRVDRIAPVPQGFRKKYLLRSRNPDKGAIRMAPALRRVINFYSFNLISGEYPSAPQYDVIFCRNVMIYFNGPDRERIIGQLRASLKPGGLLFIGHSESIGHQRGGFESLIPTVYRRLG